MATKRTLKAGISGPDNAAIARALAGAVPALAQAPETLRLDDEEGAGRADWIEPWGTAAEVELFARWPDRRQFVSIRKSLVTVQLPELFAHPGEVLALLSAVPFELASFASLHLAAWIEEDYVAPSFSNQHQAHGWGCAFRGAGHDRLVSGRWLDHGPWLVHRGDGDTSLVQFHDLDADAETALAQAAPAHERMGISDRGGFIRDGYRFRGEVRGLYDADARMLRVVVPAGETVSQRAMLDMCAARKLRGGPDADEPIDRVAYVFLDEGDARAHLHELWLRELECWAVVDGEERRLDGDYAPAPEPPGWAR